MRRALALVIVLWLAPFVLMGGTLFTGLGEDDFNLVRALGSPAEPLNDSTLGARLAFIGSTPRTLLVNAGVWTIANNLTIPAHVQVQLAVGASFSINTGRTLTIEDPSFRPPATQIFTGVGTVSLPNVREVFPEWWGAKGDGVTDGLLAFRRALTTLSLSGGGTLSVSDGTYLLVPDASFYIGSLATGATIDCRPGQTSVLKLGGPAELDGQARAYFQVANANDVTIRNCVFDYSGHTWKTGEPLQLYHAINVEGTSSHTVIENNTFVNNPGTQSVVVGGSGVGHVVRGNYFRNGCRDIPGGNPNCVDHTQLYVWAPQSFIEGNRFEWDAALGDPTWARSAVEIHSGGGLNLGTIVQGNQFTLTSLAIRLECDANDHQIHDSVVAHNVISQAQIGIIISSASAVTTMCSLRKLDIHDNQISVAGSENLSIGVTGVYGIGNPGVGTNRAVVYNSKIHHNTIEVANAADAYNLGNVGMWWGSLFDSTIEHNIFANGSVGRFSAGLFGMRQVAISRNLFTNVVTDFTADHGLLWLDFAGATVAAQGIVVQGNVFTRDPEAAALVNTHAFQVDGSTGTNVVFDMNHIRNIEDQFIGTLGSQNLLSQTTMRFGALDIIKGVSAVQHGLVVMSDIDPIGTNAFIKVERGSDSARDLMSLEINGQIAMRVDPIGDIQVGAGRPFQLGGIQFAGLDNIQDGNMKYCLDCMPSGGVIGNGCVGGGTGSMAVRTAGIWKCY